MRPHYWYKGIHDGEFQFTHPGRGATSLLDEPRRPDGFQFTHPGRGATHLSQRLDNVTIEFQFTHPGRGATL